jgi:hypothetical protein
MPLNEIQEKMCSESRWDFSDLKAVFLRDVTYSRASRYRDCDYGEERSDLRNRSTRRSRTRTFVPGSGFGWSGKRLHSAVFWFLMGSAVTLSMI